MSKREIEFLGLRRNALVLTGTNFFLGTGSRIGSTFLLIYARYLGAPILVLGLFGTIQGLVRLILVAPIGYLSDIVGHNRKWIIIGGDILSTLGYLVYASAGNWEWLIPGIILETGVSILAPVSMAMVSDSVNPEKRGMAIATRNLATMLPSTFTPVLGGMLLDSVGLAQGMPFLFIIGGLLRAVGTIGRILFLKEEKEQFKKQDVTTSSETWNSRTKAVVSDMFGLLLSAKTLRVMAIISFIGAIGASVIRRFQAVYVTEIIGLTNTEWGLVVGISTTIGTVLRIPIGMLTDKVGRRICILIDYCFRPIFFVVFVSARSFNEVVLLNTLYDLSGEAGSPAWQALIIDVTPRGSRGRIQGAFAMVTALSETIFPSVGAVVWETYGPVWSLYLCAIAESLAVLIVYSLLKEPERRET